MRSLTTPEIQLLSRQQCTAEDWSLITVADDFDAQWVCDVQFYGSVTIGTLNGTHEVADGLHKHSALRHATLHNVVIGDDCLIENVGLIHTSPEPEFGEGHVISVLNEAGDGNVMLSRHLNANLAALMVAHEQDRAFTEALQRLIRQEITAGVTTIGSHVRIINTTEVTDCHIADRTVIDGAATLRACTLGLNPESPVTIGRGVICHDSVVVSHSRVCDNARLESCFLGEESTVTGGFSAEGSLFFANTFMNNGESCAAFCGPFSQSHHKGSLLIGSLFSFYNAGSSTNFSNHAYKMGPMHWGVLERGTKTASGSHTLLPAQFGTFNVVLGKVQNHPDTRDLPFSYVISYGHDTYIVPGINLTTVGLYRDIRKWPKRDKRGERLTLINHDWLSPFAIREVLAGKQVLTQLLSQMEDDQPSVSYKGCLIRRSSLLKGIGYYDLALRLYLGSVVEACASQPAAAASLPLGSWSDLCGLLLPVAVEEMIVAAVTDGTVTSLSELNDRLRHAHEQYDEANAVWAYAPLCAYYGIEGGITASDVERIRADYAVAHREWIEAIERDARKEFAMGDVAEADLEHFLKGLHSEL